MLFFFQAEDGIRDVAVTGVQTCALPIYFHLYRVEIERGHLVAGFGRINWVEAAELRFSADARPLADAEPEILEHMNRDHAEAIELYANRLIGRQGAGWRMTGIDPEGIDLRRSMEARGETAR